MDIKNLKEFEVSLENANNIATIDVFEALLPEQRQPIGGYGRLHKEYLKINHPSVFDEMIRSNILWDYLARINEQAEKAIKLLSDEHQTPATRKQREEVLTNIICRFTPNK